MINLLSTANLQLPKEVERISENYKDKLREKELQFSEDRKKVTDRKEHTSEHVKVAKEIESLFAHQLLKVMRQTAASVSGENKGNGQDTYMTLFDIEVSKLFAERGLGLQDAIIQWLERSPDTGGKDGKKGAGGK